MADDLEKRIEKLESRLDEHLGVIHSFIDELRADRSSSRERIDQNEEGLRAGRELSHALTILQGEALRMINDLTMRANGHEDRLDNAGL